MGKILDMRRTMGGNQDVLPKDVIPIEYLESSGTQWIDTLVNQKETQIYLSVEVNIQVPVLESGEHDIAGSGLGSTPTMGYSDSSYFTWSYSGTMWTPKSANTDWHNNIYIFSTNGVRRFSEDGISFFTQTINVFGGGAFNSLFLFASSPNRFPLKCRLKSVKIIIDDVLRFDAIPVRVGQVGYMYDKVSKQLFGNAGTGKFILGADKVGGGKYLIINMLRDYSAERRVA